MQNACYAAVNQDTDLLGNMCNIWEGSKGHIPELYNFYNFPLHVTQISELPNMFQQLSKVGEYDKKLLKIEKHGDH